MSEDDRNAMLNVARLRRWFWRHLMRYDSELCDDCGRKIEVIWTAPDWMWGQAMGHEGGILCPRCFDARMGHPNVLFIRWIPEVE